MSKKKQPSPPKTPAEIKKEFLNTIQQLSYSRHKWQAWQDFTELAALSIAQSTNYSDKREETYMRTIGRYTPEEIQLFPKLLALTIHGLETKYHDFLGSMFMELELGSECRGQFFTPYELCLLIAQLTISEKQFENNKIVSLNEPAVGAGAMVIAVCEHLRNKKINYQRQLKITTQDTDYTACCMCYIQLSLLGCSAVVIHGNTLTLECRDCWYTPLAMVQYFSHWAQDTKEIETEIEAPSSNLLMGHQTTLDMIGANQ